MTKQKIKNLTNVELVNHMLADPKVSFSQFYDFMRDQDIGDWDDINSLEVIRQYISEQMDIGVHVSHILEVIENNPSSEEVYRIWLGNSMETPVPINTKQELYDTLMG